MRISDWSSDVCSSDLLRRRGGGTGSDRRRTGQRRHAAGAGGTGGRLMAGRYYDEWTIGDRIDHEIRRTVTETDNLLFSTMTHNPQPLHLAAEAAKASEFGPILVNGTYTFAPMVGHSDKSRVGKEGVSTGKSGLWP